MIKKAVLISKFNFYDNRIKYVKAELIKKGFNVLYITSDFNHIEKKKMSTKIENSIEIETMPYKKNFSIKRILSHYKFSKSVYKEINKINPDLIYAIIPPNFLVKYLSKYKRRKNVKLIYDIYDLWPETFPNKKNFIMKLAFLFWSNLRDKNLKYANKIVLECHGYKNILGDKIEEIPNYVFYPYLGEYIEPIAKTLNFDISFCYLGSINNIIDINLIVKILAELNKNRNVNLNIIGSGEKIEELLYLLNQNKIKYKNYGKIFDITMKKKIFEESHFGINIMKETVEVGMTLKSTEYFMHGLPIINNIKYDSTDLVKDYKIGYNIKYNNLEEIVRKFEYITNEEYNIMVKNVKKMYNENFSIKSNVDTIKEVID